jgi:transposase
LVKDDVQLEAIGMWSGNSDAQDCEVQVTVGVDTHTDQHVGVALDQFGRRLGTRSVPTTPAGFAELVAWSRTFGTLEQFGVEGTGSYGAGLTRWLRARGLAVIEVERPRRHDRQARRRHGKSDPLDAEAAARTVQAGTVIGQPKAGDGHVEMIRTLRLARRSAMKARTQAANQLHAVVVTAPDALRARLRALPMAELITLVAACRPVRSGSALSTPLAAAKLALKGLAIRYRQLSAEIDALDMHLEQLVATAAPELIAVKGVGPDIAGALLVAAGDNPDRLHSEAAFASLCGVAPIPASSGKTNRHRLSRGGDRDANRALYLLALGRMGWDPRTRTYGVRRTAAGLSKPEIIRCLKRYLARELFHILTGPAPSPPHSAEGDEA